MFDPVEKRLVLVVMTSRQGAMHVKKGKVKEISETKTVRRPWGVACVDITRDVLHALPFSRSNVELATARLSHRNSASVPTSRSVTIKQYVSVNFTSWSRHLCRSMKQKTYLHGVVPIRHRVYKVKYA